MLREFWNIVRLSFKKRFIIYYVVVLSLTLFGTFPSLIVRFAALAVFLGATILFVPIFTSQFVTTLRLILAHRKRVRLPVSFEIAALSKRMSVDVKELGIVKGCTAYVKGKCLVLGKELLEDFTFHQRQAVVGHELGHIKEKHALLRLVLLAPLLSVPLFIWSRLSSPIFFSESLTQLILVVMWNIAALAYVVLVAIPVNWYLELRADRAAAKFVGKEHIKSALLKLGKKKSLKEPSETHPSIADRVKAIDKLEV